MAAQAAVAAGIEPERRSGFVLAISEVVSNALMHGHGDVVMTIEPDEHALVVTVCSGGVELTVLDTALPPAQDLRGRGLWLARQLTDELTVSHAAGQTTVRLVVHRGDIQPGRAPSH
jgi:anti-sigma regulatory factor (Ser/Thr protein kinase)